MARAMSTVGQIRKLISGKDPAQVAQVLAKTNPQFAAFWDKNASRPLNDVLQEYGIDAEGFQCPDRHSNSSCRKGGGGGWTA